MMTPSIKMRLANMGKGYIRAEANTIWLYETIAADADEAAWFGGIAPDTFIAAIKGMSGPVTLRLNSPGGSVFGAQAMVAAIREYPHPVTAQVDSLAASAASVIASACSSCAMVPGSLLMIHKAWGVGIGNEADLRGLADLLDKIDGQIAANYAAKSGGDAEAFLALMAAETWFTPEEAIAAGLADSINHENTQKPKAMWDLSAFERAPKAHEAPVVAEEPAIEPEETPPEIDLAALAAMRGRQLAARLASTQI